MIPTTHSEPERWLPVKGFEGAYEVSSLGRVRSLDRTVLRRNGMRMRVRGRMISTETHSEGYPKVHLSLAGSQRAVRVYRLVAEAFVPGCEPGMEVCHIDGDPKNSDFRNLRWGTRSSNMLDRVLHGTHHNAAKGACKHGHLFSVENTIQRKEGGRACKACRRARQKRYGERLRSQGKA